MNGMNDDKRVSPIQNFVAAVVGWDPADHDGQYEPWESLKATLDAGLPDLLASRGLQLAGQAVGSVPIYRRDDPEDPMQEPRYRTRRLSVAVEVVDADVPPDLACRVTSSVLGDALFYRAGDDNSQPFA